MAKTCPLTREEALKMQDALLAEYSKPEFQAKLRTVLEDSCTTKEKRELERELRELREEVGTRFGFESSPEGVEKSIKLFTPELRADPEIASNCRQMEIFLYPQLQDELMNAKQNGAVGKSKQTNNHYPPWKDAAVSIRRKAELAAKHEAEELARKQAIMAKKTAKGAWVGEKVGRYWRVIGGGSKGGIVVRRGEELGSPELHSRLAAAAVVQEMELVGDRLHYKKILGEGPDFGWVSVMVRGATLVQPCPEDFEVEVAPVASGGA